MFGPATRALWACMSSATTGRVSWRSGAVRTRAVLALVVETKRRCRDRPAPSPARRTPQAAARGAPGACGVPVLRLGAGGVGRAGVRCVALPVAKFPGTVKCSPAVARRTRRPRPLVAAGGARAVDGRQRRAATEVVSSPCFLQLSHTPS
eukprot:SAG22_NODE_79_length_21845_cov_17.798538_9_plen_150_part_00